MIRFFSSIVISLLLSPLNTSIIGKICLRCR
nr:MAG TPA: Linker for activation of T-cells [Caudoviricetes sp.]